MNPLFSSLSWLAALAPPTCRAVGPHELMYDERRIIAQLALNHIVRSARFRKPFQISVTAGNDSKIVLAHVLTNEQYEKELGVMNGEAILENVRRYGVIASLYRQTAAFRPDRSWSLLDQAREWEFRALSELEDYFSRIQRKMGQGEISFAS